MHKGFSIICCAIFYKITIVFVAIQIYMMEVLMPEYQMCLFWLNLLLKFVLLFECHLLLYIHVVLFYAVVSV